MKNKTVAVLLCTAEGKIIMQKRDDKPGIDYPGYVTLFGGSCIPNESPLNAAIREIHEELSLNLEPDCLKLWRCFDKKPEKDGSPARLHIFTYGKPISEGSIEVREGRGYRLVGSDDDFDRIKLTNLAKIFIPEYLNILGRINLG